MENSMEYPFVPPPRGGDPPIGTLPPRTLRRPPPAVSSHHSTPDGRSLSFVSTPSASTSTTSFLPSDAPTPYNTYFTSDDVYDSRSIGTPSSGEDKEMIYHSPLGLGGDVSFDPSLSPSSSVHLRSSQGGASTHSTSSRLLPSHRSSTSAYEPGIPFSSRPIPAPPLSLRHPHHRRSSDFDIPPVTSASRGLPRSPMGVDGSGSVDESGVGPPAFAGGTAESSGSRSDVESSAGGVGKGKKSESQEDVDAQRLQQMGYDAVLGRDYTFWSSLAISYINIGALQGTVYAVSGAYSYGGPMMMLVAWPISGVFMVCLNLTMSELASAYPVAGAMASWSWKLARGGVGGERIWGWLMSGTVMGGHISSILLVTWELVNIINGIMNLAFEYQAKMWASVLFFLAIIWISGFAQSLSAGRSHRFWLLSGFFAVSMWAVLCVALLATSVRRQAMAAEADLSRFYNDTGWTSKPYVYLLGWEYCTLATGADASAHMAEETQNPSRNVPKAMTSGIVLTYVLGYISIILLLLSIQPDEGAIVAAHAFPGYILQRAVSKPGAIAISILIALVLNLQVMAQMQAASRFVFALARDNALPFSKHLRYTNSNRLPIIAIWVIVGLCTPLSLLLVDSQVVLYGLVATTATTLSFVGYVVPVILYIVSKKDLQTEGRTSWSLRGFSRPVAVIGAAFTVLAIVVTFVPSSSPVTAETISWSPIILAVTALLSLFTWFLYGNKNYSGPIRAITKWQTGVEIDLHSALASRSRTTQETSAQKGQERMETASSFKLDLEQPYDQLAHTVTVEAAYLADTSGQGDWQHTAWSGGTGTTDSGTAETGSTITRGTMSRQSRGEEQ